MREPKVGDIIIAPPSVTGICCGLNKEIYRIFTPGKGKIRVNKIASKSDDHPYRFFYNYKTSNADQWSEYATFWICAKNWPKSTFIYEEEVPYICPTCLTNEWNEKEDYKCIYCSYDFFLNYYLNL